MRKLVIFTEAHKAKIRALTERAVLGDEAALLELRKERLRTQTGSVRGRRNKLLARRWPHLTIPEVAEKCHVSGAAICLILNGKRKPGFELLSKLSNVLGVSPSTLVDELKKAQKSNDVADITKGKGKGKE